MPPTDPYLRYSFLDRSIWSLRSTLHFTLQVTRYVDVSAYVSRQYDGPVIYIVSRRPSRIVRLTHYRRADRRRLGIPRLETAASEHRQGRVADVRRLCERALAEPEGGRGSGLDPARVAARPTQARRRTERSTGGVAHHVQPGSASSATR